MRAIAAGRGLKRARQRLPGLPLCSGAGLFHSQRPDSTESGRWRHRLSRQHRQDAPAANESEYPRQFERLLLSY